MEEKLNTEIIPVPVQPLESPEEAVQSLKTFEEMKAKLLTTTDYQIISGKKYIKKSGFRKFSVVFNLSDSILESERTDREDGSFYWRIVVEVKAPNGRTCVGVGICDSKERKFAHVEHDVYSTCHTRSKNRAVSDMIAGGVASAEEMTSTKPAEDRKTKPTPKERATTKPSKQNTVHDADVLDALMAAELSSDVLNVRYDLETEGLVISVRGSMGKVLWRKYDSVMRKLGLSWDSSEKPNVWK